MASDCYLSNMALHVCVLLLSLVDKTGKFSFLSYILCHDRFPEIIAVMILDYFNHFEFRDISYFSTIYFSLYQLLLTPKLRVTIRIVDFLIIAKLLWKTIVYFVVLIYSAPEQLTPFYDNASGTA